MILKSILNTIKNFCAGCALPVQGAVQGCKSCATRVVRGVQDSLTHICTHVRICAHPRVYVPMHTLHTLHNADAVRACDFLHSAQPTAHPALVFSLLLILFFCFGEKEMNGYVALEQWQYQDPERILIREQSKSCLGCIYVREMLDREYCGIEKRFGRGCESKREAENGDA